MSERSDGKPHYKEGEETGRFHVWLYVSDIAWIDENIEKVKRSKFIRLALRRMIRSVQERSAQGHKTLHEEDENEEQEHA